MLWPDASRPLVIETIAASHLYPEGEPAAGSLIDLDDHLGRFPAGALVLTTGAKHTHVRQRRVVILGPGHLSRRVLAHEFGHLLGFSDACLRGYEGDPLDPWGAVIVEWDGLTDDLMSSPGRGRVSQHMIQQLLSAYSTTDAKGGVSGSVVEATRASH